MSLGKYKIGNQESIKYSMSIINKVNELNQSNSSLYKSIQSLGCSKDELIKSFYFISDNIYFSENDSRIYKNHKLGASNNELHAYVNLYFADVNPKEIPTDRIENVKWGNEFSKNNDLEKTQLYELSLINWRTKDQWEFWADKYGEESELGKYCLEQYNKIYNKELDRERKNEENEKIIAIENKNERKKIKSYLIEISLIIALVLGLFYNPIQKFILILYLIMTLSTFFIFPNQKDFSLKKYLIREIIFIILAVIGFIFPVIAQLFISFNLSSNTRTFYNNITKREEKYSNLVLYISNIIFAIIVTFLINR
jgi:hypothetical protein